jgi:hypothetical protein
MLDLPKIKKASVPARPKPNAPISVAQLLDQPPRKPLTIIPGFLPVGVTALLDGTGQAGRSLALDFAVAVATGEPVLQRKPVHLGVVLYLFPTHHRLSLHRQLYQLAQSLPHLAKASITMIPLPEWSDDVADVIQEWLAKTKPRLVVIDGLINDDLDTYTADLRRLARRDQFAVLVVANQALAPDTWARPWLWLAAHPSLAGVMCLEPAPQSGKAQLTVVNGQMHHEKHWALKRELATDRYRLASWAQSSPISQQRQAVVKLLRAGKALTTHQIAKQIGSSMDATRQLLRSMTLKGQVMVGKKRHGQNVFTLPR